jgi:Ubiquitin-conjugating enzyme
MLHSKELQFDLYLEGKYPFQAPKLLFESVISFPSAADGRDMLSEILKQKWTPSITSADIIGLIPHFFANVLSKIQSELQNKDFGKFHLGNPYYLETWERKESMGCYYCTESDIKTQKPVKEKMIAVTHTIILQFELNQEYPGIGYLISWATLQSLNTIKRSRQETDKITLEWKQIGDNLPYSQQFKIPQANEFIDLISRNMQRIGAIVKKNSMNSVFQEDEVNGKAIKKMNINEILQAIEVYEDNIQSLMNVDLINSLLELYQQAIEYFAAVSNPQYDIFLKRMHMLLSNETVLAVLQGKSPQVNETGPKTQENKLQESLVNLEEAKESKNDDKSHKEIMHNNLFEEKNPDPGHNETSEDLTGSNEALLATELTPVPQRNIKEPYGTETQDPNIVHKPQIEENIDPNPIVQHEIKEDAEISYKVQDEVQINVEEKENIHESRIIEPESKEINPSSNLIEEKKDGKSNELDGADDVLDPNQVDNKVNLDEKKLETEKKDLPDPADITTEDKNISLFEI